MEEMGLKSPEIFYLFIIKYPNMEHIIPPQTNICSKYDLNFPIVEPKEKSEKCAQVCDDLGVLYRGMRSSCA